MTHQPNQPVIYDTGLFTPPFSISNDELVAAFNAYVRQFNIENAQAIEAGTMAPLGLSSPEFIEKASGIKSRYVLNKEGILDPARMAPNLPERSNDEISVMAEIGVKAAQMALEKAAIGPEKIDGLICAASNMQRAYPAMAIEIQHYLGLPAHSFAYDMNVACSSATFGIAAAADAVRSGRAKHVLVVNPEICSGHLNFKDRDSHFIFGDVATAILVSAKSEVAGPHWDILGTKIKTQFSNNIRNNFGFLNRAAPEGIGAPDKLFVQEGRKVFKEVVPWVADLIITHRDELGLNDEVPARLWLHQANINMNRLISGKILGRDATAEESPTVLDTYANTSSAGSIIAFHLHQNGLNDRALGLICSFGAGYSAGSVFIRKVAK